MPKIKMKQKKKKKNKNKQKKASSTMHQDIEQDQFNFDGYQGNSEELTNQDQCNNEFSNQDRDNNEETTNQDETMNDEPPVQNWEEYWSRYGDYLVWESWVQKYPECNANVNESEAHQLAPESGDQEQCVENYGIAVSGLEENPSVNMCSESNNLGRVCDEVNSLTLTSTAIGQDSPEQVAMITNSQKAASDVLPSVNFHKQEIVTNMEQLQKVTGKTGEQTCNKSQSAYVPYMKRCWLTSPVVDDTAQVSSSKLQDDKTKINPHFDECKVDTSMTRTVQNKKELNVMSSQAADHGAPECSTGDNSLQNVHGGDAMGWTDEWKLIWDGHYNEIYCYYQDFYYTHLAGDQDKLGQSEADSCVVDQSGGGDAEHFYHSEERNLEAGSEGDGCSLGGQLNQESEPLEVDGINEIDDDEVQDEDVDVDGEPYDGKSKKTRKIRQQKYAKSQSSQQTGKI